MGHMEMRDYIIESLTKLGSMALVELNGFNFSGADIATENKDGDPESYRIVVISHKPQKQFT